MLRQKINGILLLDKPFGLTSNQALQRVKHLFQAQKAGHTGSLDPIATGMLPICFGEATKFSQFLLDACKFYSVVAKLGEKTKTGDTEGEIILKRPVENITEQQISTALTYFSGEIEQIPPMYSAIKMNGKPLYQLARAGIEVERSPRKVTIHNISLKKIEKDHIEILVHCSKGTYIRTLVEDLGEKLGCGAHVAALHRLAVEPYQHFPMIDIQEIEAKAKEGLKNLEPFLLSVETSVNCYPAVKLSTAAAFYLKMGQAVRAQFPINSSLVRLISVNDEFIGLGEVLSDGRVKPHRLLKSLKK